jgi:ankyrin repeat protein
MNICVLGRHRDTLPIIDVVPLVGMSPVHFAAAAGSMCVLKYILERGVDPAMPDSSRGCTPLHCAAEEGVLFTFEGGRLGLARGHLI